MTSPFANTTGFFTGLIRYKREWYIILGLGFFLSFLFKFLLYSRVMTDASLFVITTTVLFSFQITIVWHFLIGFLGGLTLKNAEFVEQLIISVPSVLFILVVSLLFTPPDLLTGFPTPVFAFYIAQFQLTSRPLEIVITVMWHSLYMMLTVTSGFTIGAVTSVTIVVSIQENFERAKFMRQIFDD